MKTNPEAFMTVAPATTADAPVLINGVCDARFAAVREAFERALADQQAGRLEDAE